MKLSIYKLRRVKRMWFMGFPVSFIAKTERVARCTITAWLRDAGVDTNVPLAERRARADGRAG